MHEDKPSLTARKVALAVITLGAQPGTSELLPAGVACATEELLLSAGAVGLRAVRFARSVYAASIYNAFPEAGVDAFVDFMDEFARVNG